MKRNYTLWVICGTLGILGLVYLFYRFPHVRESEDHLAYFVRTLLILCFLIPTLFLHYNASQVLKYGVAWGSIFFILFAGYSYHEDLSTIWEKLKSNLLPFSGTLHADGSISFIRAENNHFLIEALVNNIPVQFMVDTGASYITLTPQDAKRLGFDVDSLSYSQLTQTANGATFVASVYLKEIQLGQITIQNLSASVSQNLSGCSLLGMNFLKQLKGFKIVGDTLTLEGPSL